MDVVSYILAKKNGGGGSSSVSWDNIKDKPFGVEPIYNLVTEVSLASYKSYNMGAYFYELDTTFMEGITENDKFKMIIDGMEYELIYYDGYNLSPQGDVYLSDGTNIGTVDLRYKTKSLGIYGAYGKDISMHTVYVYKAEEHVKKLDHKFIPDKIYTEDTLYSESTNFNIEPFGDGTGYRCEQIDCPKDIKSKYTDQDKLYVIIDDTKIHLPLGSGGLSAQVGEYYYGNRSLEDTNSANTGEDYLIYYYATGGMFQLSITVREQGMHELEIYVETCQKIATQNYVTELFNSIVNGNEVEY